AELQWDGSAVFPDGRIAPALTPEEMAELATALAENNLPRAELLAKAQAATGSDAAFQLSAAGEDIPGDSTGGKVAKGVAIAVFFAIVLVAIILASKSRGGGSAPARAAGHFAGGAGRVTVATPPVGAVSGVVRPAVFPVPTGHVHGPGCNILIGIHDGVFYGPPPAPEHEGQSGLGVSMRLFDLRQPRVLWSADQWAEGSPREGKFVQALGAHVGASIPTAR